MTVMLRFKNVGMSLAMLLLTTAAAAQTGKIVGTVTDASTGDPLPGVNVFIEGTTQGTATGLDGDFVIIGVRPGVYTISASFIGFTTQRKEGVQVSLDLTTTVDFELGEQVMELIRAEMKQRGTAAIVVTHDERITRHCDRTVHIVDGRLAA